MFIQHVYSEVRVAYQRRLMSTLSKIHKNIANNIRNEMVRSN